MTFKPVFREAQRSQSKACIVIEGLSGSGKSGLALAIARALASGWEKIYGTDTENRSMDLFDGIRMHTGVEPFGKFRKFDLLSVHGYAPTHYLAAMQHAVAEGAEVYIHDSITHMWQQKGGLLEIVSEAQRRDPKLNKWTAWGTPEVLTQKAAVLDCIRSSEVHVISTVRVKEKHELVEGKMQSLGEQQQQMPDLKYEPDLVIHMLKPGNEDGTPPRGRIGKSRYTIFKQGEEYEFTASLLEQLRQYLEEGADPAVLLEAQRIEFIQQIIESCEGDASLKQMLPMIMDQVKIPRKKLNELTLAEARTLLTVVLS